MSCESDLEEQRRQNAAYRSAILGNRQAELIEAQRIESGLAATLSSLRQSSATTTGAASAQRQATTRGEEQRGGNGEMAQYAALLRDIEDMEARLDKLETK